MIMDKEIIAKFRSSTTIYDIFGYLLPGFFFICLIIVDFDFGRILNYYFENNKSLEGLYAKTDGSHWKMAYLFKFLTWNSDMAEFKFTTLLILIFFCYLLGHAIAAISSIVLENWFNRKYLGFPSRNLLNEYKPTLSRLIFSPYTKPLDSAFISKFKSVFNSKFEGIIDEKSIYWLCFTEISKRHPTAYNRIMHFLSLYGFSRNVSACFFLYVFCRVLFSCLLGFHLSKYNIIINIVFVSSGVVMFVNYLKLFHRQCYELYYHFYALCLNDKTSPNSIVPEINE